MHPLLASVLLLAPQGLSDAEFDKLSTPLRFERQAWAAIPWTVSVRRARDRAVRDKKPLFLQINTGNPIGFA